jgi:hypothetical protein
VRPVEPLRDSAKRWVEALPASSEIRASGISPTNLVPLENLNRQRIQRICKKLRHDPMCPLPHQANSAVADGRPWSEAQRPNDGRRRARCPPRSARAPARARRRRWGWCSPDCKPRQRLEGGSRRRDRRNDWRDVCRLSPIRGYLVKICDAPPSIRPVIACHGTIHAALETRKCS